MPFRSGCRNRRFGRRVPQRLELGAGFVPWDRRCPERPHMQDGHGVPRVIDPLGDCQPSPGPRGDQGCLGGIDLLFRRVGVPTDGGVSSVFADHHPAPDLRGIRQTDETCSGPTRLMHDKRRFRQLTNRDWGRRELIRFPAKPAALRLGGALWPLSPRGAVVRYPGCGKAWI